MDGSVAFLSRLGSHPVLGAVMRAVQMLVDYFAPLFLISSPVTSYADQIWSIHKTKSSAGFSLDIPLIMLVASILKVFYWFGAYYSTSLLTQALLMIGVQLVLLKVALDNRPSPGLKDSIEHAPFSTYTSGPSSSSSSSSTATTPFSPRPYNFWLWRSPKPYWNFLGYFSVTLLCAHILLSWLPLYTSVLGYLGLGVEAVLPLPQILTNQRRKSCRGFRVSVLAMWLMGDVMKMSYFFLSKESIPWAFRYCGVFQFGCDVYLGLQYLTFGNGVEVQSGTMGELGWGEKDVRIS